MKNQTSGALIAPEPAGIRVSENLKALNEQVSNIQCRYYRVLAPRLRNKDRSRLLVLPCHCLGMCRDGVPSPTGGSRVVCL